MGDGRLGASTMSRIEMPFDVAAARIALAAGLVAVASGCAPTSSGSLGFPAASVRESRDEAVPPSLAAATANTITSVPVARKPWRFAGYEGQIITTRHYRVHTTMQHSPLLDRLPLFLERALDHYMTVIAQLPEPPSRLETYLFETRNQWEAKTRQMLPEQAATFLTLGRGGFTTRSTSVLYYIGRSDTLAIAAHEGWHQYSQRTFENQLPIWLEEGLATYMEGYVSHPDGQPKFRPWANLERYHTLRDAMRKCRLIPLHDLLHRTPESFLKRGKNKLLIYYAQLWALTHFLAEGDGGRYREGLQQVLLDAAAGRLTTRLLGSNRERRRAGANPRVGPWVLLEYFNRDLEVVEQRYLRFVRNAVRTGGRDRIVRGRSPVEK
jgi:hypothetical protein